MQLHQTVDLRTESTQNLFHQFWNHITQDIDFTRFKSIFGKSLFKKINEKRWIHHWELWLHLYRGELFNAPTGTTGVRKPVRAGCLNLVLKTGKTERPREYIPVGLSTNHAGWDSQWFYLRNDDDLLPAYTGRLITERPENWTYSVVQVHQSRLDPLLDVMKKLRSEGLTAALVLSADHHRRVLALMSRPLRMDEMAPGASSRDLEACRMSSEAPANDEVAARVRAAIASDFKLEHVNSFPMRPDAGSIDLVCFLLVRSLDSGFLFLPFF